MKKTMNILAVLAIAFLCASCASSGHEKYRGHENTPFTNFERHQVNPNAVMQMSSVEFNEHMRKLNSVQDYKDRMNKTNAGSAAAESMWVTPTKGGFIGDLFKVFSDTATGIVKDTGNETRRQVRDSIRR